MDLPLYLHVLWRFRALVAAGLALAILLAVLAYASISFDGGIKLTPRGSETWQSQSVVLVTQTGFPYGRAVPQYTEPDPEGGAPAVPLGDQDRFAALAQIYSQLANSEPVRARLRKHVPTPGTVLAEATINESGQPLPLMTITATSGTAANAEKLATDTTKAFRAYVAQQQDGANISSGERTRLEVLESGKEPLLIEPRKKTLPGLVFFAVMAAVLGLVFVMENLRPTRRAHVLADPWLASVPEEDELLLDPDAEQDPRAERLAASDRG
jgi:hypothetical protein